MPALEMGGFTNDLEDLDSFFESVFSNSGELSSVMPLALALLFSRDNFWKGANFDTNLEAFSNNAHVLIRAIFVLTGLVARLNGMKHSDILGCFAIRVAELFLVQQESVGSSRSAQYSISLSYMWMDRFLRETFDLLPVAVIDDIIPQSMMRPHILKIYTAQYDAMEEEEEA